MKTSLNNNIERHPFCHTFITTGDKATETMRLHFSNKIKHPPVGGFESFKYLDRDFNIYRLPSSSRTYPMTLIKKAAVYKHCFEDVGML